MDKELQELKKLCQKVYGKSNDFGHITNFSFKVLENALSKKVDIMERYRITECELYVLLLLEGFHPNVIQRSSSETKEFTDKCRFYLDSLLAKTPQTKSDVLYRQEESYRIDFDRMKHCMNKGIPYVHPCYMTTSTDDYDNKDCKFVIVPLKNGKTKAHDIYLISNHGAQCPYPENQVEFELGTKFMINKIEETTIFMHEIE